MKKFFLSCGALMALCFALNADVKEINSMDELKYELATAEGTVFVDCYSKGCPPCKMLSPKYEQYSRDLSSKGKFLKVNVGNNPDVAKEYQVTGVPKLLVFKNGKLVDSVVGMPNIPQYFEEIK